MSIFRAVVLSMAIVFMLAGCASVPESNTPQVSDQPEVAEKSEVPDMPRDLNPGGPVFSDGIIYYEEGKYALAERNLKNALSLGLSNPADAVSAHKYLAFLYCVSSRKTLCREEFKKAFELDPGFTLSPAEKGHPMWRKIYLQVKKQMAPVKKKP